MGRHKSRFEELLGEYTLTAYCDNFRCPRSLKCGTALDIADLIRRGYKGEIGRTIYRCTWCRQPGSVRISPINASGFGAAHRR